VNFDSEWERCKHWIEAALEYNCGAYRIEDVESEIRSGRLQFWPGRNCAGVTEVIEYPRLKALNHFLAGGDLKELLEELEPQAVAWGKSMGCSRVIQSGRLGWGRVLNKMGYVTTHSIMMKDI
jgi:hypothetical protein